MYVTLSSSQNSRWLALGFVSSSRGLNSMESGRHMKMGKLVGLCVILIGLLFSFVEAGVYYDPESEAIVIDDTVIYDPASFNPPEQDAMTTMRPEGHCITPGGGDGVCLPLRECFPYADYVLNEDGSVLSEYIMGVVNSTESSCSEEQGNVCCPSVNYKHLPSKRPSVLPQFPAPTRVPSIVLNVTTEVIDGSGIIVIDDSTTTNTTTTTTTTTTAKPPSSSTIRPKPKPSTNKPNKLQCGSHLKVVDDLVVGGRYAAKGEFPWAVALTNNGRQFCGGSLIKPNYVLTAAHCVQELRNAAGVRVLIGAHNIEANEPGREVRSLTKILYHRSFSMRNLANDVAILQLNSPVSYNQLIQPVCLNAAELTHKERVDLAGWGKQGQSLPPSKTLKTVNMMLISPAECKRRYRGTNAPPITPGMICAGEQSPSVKDACNGDSGGPLTLKVGDQARQVGVVSWGIGCGDYPGVYARVSEYLPWITKNSQ